MKTGFYRQLFRHETMKLLRATKSKTNKNNNNENVPHFEITDVFVHCNINNSNYQQNSSLI